MKVGFTGTREGMTLRQGWAFSDWFEYPKEWPRPRAVAEFHHGCCVGADSEAVTQIIRSRIGATTVRAWVEIHAHPSNLVGMTDKGAEAHSDVAYPEKPPLDRNKDIVDVCDVLIACPRGPEERRSGTWSTIRYARREGKRVVIIWPDGTVEGS